LAVAKISESNLYLPVKRYLEKLGFEVKGEICGCDLVALRGDEPPIVVIGELKLTFNLELLLQGTCVQLRTAMVRRAAYRGLRTPYHCSARINGRRDQPPDSSRNWIKTGGNVTLIQSGRLARRIDSK
jgi:hypothetical protein